jgi:transcriptional regulator with GAF, ATPase, and Fis domain
VQAPNTMAPAGAMPEPEFESLKGLLLDMAQERSLDSLLRLVVRRLAERPHMALARVWLIGPGDVCASCRMRPECPDRTSCLHLVASAGQSRADPGQDWSRLDGDFRRFPIGVRKVGRIALGESVHIPDIAEDSRWIARPEWAQREGVRGFAGHPLVFRGEVLGVLAVFTLITAPREGVDWLRLLADHAATAIANARAFEEIELLRRQLALENEYLRAEVSEAHTFGELLGTSPALRNVIQQVELVAPTDASVLVLGESGTGKELVAREIHRRSRRKDRPMIKVNCASVPKELYESEFFGHVKGAFTGAVRDRAGRFELADGGTLFLDEVGEIPVGLQSKLLRVLQEGTYERVGDERTRKTDVRLIAATNRDLKGEVDSGRFRQDLYYRINVFPIEVAPLRERREDIPALATCFAEQAARKLGCETPRLTQAAVLELQQYDWPGNVRELQNILERAVITARCGTLRFDLPRPAPLAPVEAPTSVAPSRSDSEIVPDAELRRRERANLLSALEQTGWKIYGQDGAAALLGVRPTTLSSRIKKLGLRKR